MEIDPTSPRAAAGPGRPTAAHNATVPGELRLGGSPPVVSVIIPVRNDPAGIERCVGALRRQSYPEDRIEILVVDNGSTDRTPEVIAALDVRPLREPSARNSYAARNCGLSAASGEIIAFTDADCTPCAGWIEAGVRRILAMGADLVGGPVRFHFDGRPSGAQIWDAASNMQVKRSIETRGVAKTANLFVRRQVVEEIGPFPVASRSGGDVAWTGRATAAGFSLLFEPAAEVEHPARRLAALIRKQMRVGVGQAAMLGRSRGARRAFWLVVPPSKTELDEQLRGAGLYPPSSAFGRVWMAAWMCRVATAAGILSSIWRKPSAGAGR